MHLPTYIKLSLSFEERTYLLINFPYLWSPKKSIFHQQMYVGKVHIKVRKPVFPKSCNFSQTKKFQIGRKMQRTDHFVFTYLYNRFFDLREKDQTQAQLVLGCFKPALHKSHAFSHTKKIYIGRNVQRTDHRPNIYTPAETNSMWLFTLAF